MKSRIIFHLILISTITIVHLSCVESVSPVEVENQENERIKITNNDGELERRITYYDDKDVPIDSGGSGLLAKILDTKKFSLKLIAEVLPPSSEGQTLQATSVTMKKDLAIVSYNMRGASYLGAIDVFDVKNEDKPKLKSSAIFNDSDINSVTIEGSYVYATGATEDVTFDYPAVVERIKVKRNKLDLTDNLRVGLTSYAGTGVAATKDFIYVTDGNTGGLSVFDEKDLTLSTSFSLHDARWVDVNDNQIVVFQGTPGQIMVYDVNNLASFGPYTFPGADIVESKSTVQVLGGKVFVAAGTGGVQIIDLSSGLVIGSVDRPDPASLGLDPSVVVTNAVAVAKDLMFISNGEAGVYVAQGDKDFDKSGLPTITMLGQLKFDNLQSVNHVAVDDKYLFIASGLGGLKIVEIKK